MDKLMQFINFEKTLKRKLQFKRHIEHSRNVMVLKS